MGLKPDFWIRKMALEHDMINPFLDGQNRNGVISYGLSSYGYDIRVADEFKVFTPGMGDLAVVDPKHLDTRALVDFTGDVCIIPPNSFALARSLEYIRMPRDVLGIPFGKSTYLRCGVAILFSPLEPDWHGYITIAIANTLPLPVKVYAHEGIAQILFFEADAVCETSYGDRQGKYQGVRNVTLSRV